MIKPKSYITKEHYEALPKDERPKSFVCDKHGEFEVKYERVLNRIGVLMAICPECSKEYSEWESKQKEVEEKEKLRRNKQLALEGKLRDCGINERHFDKSFDSYIADTKEKEFALKSMRYFAERILEGESKNVILCGSVGTGKTHLCQATVRYLIENNQEMKIKMSTITKLIRFYRNSWSKDTEYSEQEAINLLSNLDLLIIDEMGIQSGSENELNIIFELINNRYEKKLPTAIISNLQKDELVNLLGTRIIDRLKEDGCRVLGMAWDSYRETNKADF